MCYNGREDQSVLEAAMKIKYFERVTKEAYLADIMELLSLCDQEFIPPLSARSSTIQEQPGPSGREEGRACGLF